MLFIQWTKSNHKNKYRKAQKKKTLTAVLIVWVAASHWSFCFMKRVMVAAKARISRSIRFSLMKHSCTQPLTASTNESETRAAFQIASFFDFSVKIINIVSVADSQNVVKKKKKFEIFLQRNLRIWEESQTGEFTESERGDMMIVNQFEQSGF